MKIEKIECSYQVTECDLKFGKQITLDGEVLIPASVFDKIRAEIEEVELNITYKENYKVGGTWGLRKALEIIDKYKAESEK